MAQEGNNGFDAFPVIASYFGGAMAEYMRCYIFQARPLRVALQVLVEAVRADSEERSIVGKRLQRRALGFEPLLDGEISVARELSMAERAALRANVVEDISPALLQVSSAKSQELRSSEPRQYGGDNQCSITLARWGGRDGIKKGAELFRRKPPRGWLLGLGALYIVGGVALDEPHATGEVIEAAKRGESDANSRGRWHLARDARAIGEGMELGGSGFRGVSDARDEALDIAGVFLGRAKASRALGDFG